VGTERRDSEFSSVALEVISVGVDPESWMEME
jgi:hypothetical protein